MQPPLRPGVKEGAFNLFAYHFQEWGLDDLWRAPDLARQEIPESNI